MRFLLFVFLLFVVAIEASFPAGASTTPQIDKIEALLARIERNLKQAEGVITMAKKKSAEMVEQKVEEKAELKEAVIVAESKVEKLEQVQEIFVTKMVQAGIDTALVVVDEAQNAGPIFDAYLEYKKNGGTEEFNYFRLYLWQQK